MHVSAFASLLYLASLDILCFVVVFCSWLLFCQLCFFLFVSSFLCPCRCLASLESLVLRLGLARGWEGGFFGGWGVGGGGQANARSALCVSPPLAGWGMRACFGSRRKKAAEISRQAQQHRGWRKLAQEGKRIADFPGRQQRSRGTHSTEDGASWLKKEKKLQISLAGSRDFVAGTAQRMAQVGSRRKKNADFVAGTAKRLKIAKSCFIFGFWTGFTWFFPGKSGFRHTGSETSLVPEPLFGTASGLCFAAFWAWKSCFSMWKYGKSGFSMWK